MSVSSFASIARLMSAAPASGCLAILLVSILLGVSPPRIAGAGEVDLIPPDPWEIIHTARAFGPADVGRDAMRDPVISAWIGGTEGGPAGPGYAITFYGCTLGRDCTTVLFVAYIESPAWADEPPEPEIFAEWNRGMLVGRAWFDGTSRAVLEHPLVMPAGLPRQSLEATFAAWVGALREFSEYLDIPES